MYGPFEIRAVKFFHYRKKDWGQVLFWLIYKFTLGNNVDRQPKLNVCVYSQDLTLCAFFLPPYAIFSPEEHLVAKCLYHPLFKYVYSKIIIILNYLVSNLTYLPLKALTIL